MLFGVQTYDTCIHASPEIDLERKKSHVHSLNIWWDIFDSMSSQVFDELFGGNFHPLSALQK